MDIKKLISNKWVEGIGITVIGGLVLLGIDYFFKTAFLKFLWNLLKTVILKVLEFFSQTYELRLWFLVLLPLFSVAVMIFILFFKNKISKNKLPDYLSYRKDMFNGIIYRWSYNSLYNYKPYDIIAHCPYCEGKIVNNRCAICYKDTIKNYSFRELINYSSKEEIIAKIDYKIENNLYKVE